MSQSDRRTHQPIPTVAYVAAGTSLSPVIGIPGIAVAIWLGTTRGPKGRVLVLAPAVLGLLLNGYIGVKAYSAWSRHSDDRTEFRGKLEQDDLRGTVRALEYFKFISGRYPRTLHELRDIEPDIGIGIWDWSAPIRSFRPPPFFYALQPGGTSYELLGVGPDGEPHTRDDIHPRLTEAEWSKVGLQRPHS